MFCANCGSEMSENDKFCGKCGWRKPEAATVSETAVPPVEPEVPVTETVAPPVEPAAPVAETVVPPVMPVVPNPVPQEKKPVKAKGNSKVGLILGIVGGIAVLLIAVCVVNAASFTNFFKKTFSSPEEYYHWVEEKTADDAATFVASVYGSYIREALHAYDTSTEGEIKLELGDAGQDMLSLAGLAGVDLSWFNNATVAFGSSVKDNAVSGNVTLQLGEDELLSLATVMDMANETGYLQIPSLSKTYVGVEADGMDETVEVMEMLKLLYENTPDQSKVEKLLSKYTVMALACIEDVEKGEKTIRAEGITEDCTELEVTIDEDAVAKMTETVAAAMAEDEDLKKIIVEMVDALNETDMELDADSAEVYEQFVDALEELENNAEYVADSDMEFVMYVYVDGKGNIRGRRFDVDGCTLKILMPHDGSNFGFEASVDAYGEKVAVVGTGKDAGGKISGDFTVKYNGTALADIDVKRLDVDKLVKGQLDANYTVSLSSSLVRAAEMASVASIVDGLSLEVNATASGDSAKIVCTLSQNEEMWGVLTMSASRGSGKKVSIPADKNVVEVEDADDLADWYDTVDWNSYLKKLDKTELPSDVVDMIEEIADMDADELMQQIYYMY